MSPQKAKTVAIDYNNFGKHGGKADLERWGVFAEMMYLHGLGMTPAPLYSKFGQGKQMLPGFPKWKTELQDCYFDHEFKRIFIGEALNSVYKRDVKERLEGKQKFRTAEGTRPPAGSKLHSTPGDFYGTFGGIVKAFDPKARKDGKDVYRQAFSIKPGKRGRPGVADITINKFPEWMPDKYNSKKAKKDEAGLNQSPFRAGGAGKYFDRNPYAVQNWQTPTYKKLREITWMRSGTFFPPKTSKKVDSMKSGFSKYPEHSADKYYSLYDITRMMKKKENERTDRATFIPCNSGKTWPILSVANLNVDFRTNNRNYRTKKPLTFTREFLHDVEN